MLLIAKRAAVAAALPGLGYDGFVHVEEEVMDARAHRNGQDMFVTVRQRPDQRLVHRLNRYERCGVNGAERIDPVAAAGDHDRRLICLIGRSAGIGLGRDRRKWSCWPGCQHGWRGRRGGCRNRRPSRIGDDRRLNDSDGGWRCRSGDRQSRSVYLNKQGAILRTSDRAQLRRSGYHTAPWRK